MAKTETSGKCFETSASADIFKFQHILWDSIVSLSQITVEE